MVLFGLETEKSEKVLTWFSQTQKRGEADDILQNPFKIRSKFFIDEKILLVLDMKPIYPCFPLFGWIIFGFMFSFWGLKWYLVFPFILGILGVFWTMPFYYIMAVQGIRKAGYHGPIKYASKKRIIEGAVF